MYKNCPRKTWMTFYCTRRKQGRGGGCQKLCGELILLLSFCINFREKMYNPHWATLISCSSFLNMPSAFWPDDFALANHRPKISNDVMQSFRKLTTWSKWVRMSHGVTKFFYSLMKSLLFSSLGYIIMRLDTLRVERGDQWPFILKIAPLFAK